MVSNGGWKSNTISSSAYTACVAIVATRNRKSFPIRVSVQRVPSGHANHAYKRKKEERNGELL